MDRELLMKAAVVYLLVRDVEMDWHDACMYYETQMGFWDLGEQEKWLQQIMSGERKMHVRLRDGKVDVALYE